jgi:class 3 adenylate cyclase/tetratricopeptide (TPR) repeat protein
MQQIAEWLEKLGMSEYAERFSENGIGVAALRHLTDQDLKDIGVLLGHRRIMLAAIAEFAGAPPEAPKTDSAKEPKALDTAERRQVTVMFSDLVGSTALSARMDPEDLREVLSAYQKCVAQTVQRFGGFVAKYMGDGVLVYFGYPEAHEDDAERAIRAGLELIEAVGGLKLSAPLQARVGIATGLVVVGDLIGSGAAQEQTVVGETPNLAARLQGIAEPNTVVIAEGTRKLLGNLFDLQDLGAQDLKGVAGPVRAWAALRASSIESRFEALYATGLTTLVGREEELELLLRRWSRAKTGEGQVVLLSGEAGIGKSRLTAALMERLEGEPHTRLRYFCSPQHTDSALYPVISQMDRAAGLAHGDTAQVKFDKLDALLAQTSTSKQDAALFAEMLSLPNDGRYPALDLEPQQRRQKTLEALAAQVEALSRQNPVLMIFEDAHWADPTSLETFGRVVDRVRSLPVLLIVTFRPEFEPPWTGRAYVTTLTINRLAERNISAMIDGVVGNKLLPAHIRQDIIERADGIPLFVEEMTKAVLEAESEGAAERAIGVIPSPAVAVPASLHAPLMARLDRLGSAKEVAQVGAAIGREFSHSLLAAVMDERERELNSALERLITAGLLFRQGAPPHATYLFKHALVQDAAYSTLLRSFRQQLHGRIAAILEGHFSEIVETQPEVLARHCAEAGFVEKAVGYWLKAGQRANARSAMTEAEAQLRKGLALLAAWPESTERQQLELDLQIALATAQMATEGFAGPALAKAVARARQLCQELDRPFELGFVLVQEAHYHLIQAELVLGCQRSRELLELGEARNYPDSKFGGCLLSSMNWYHRGDFAAARAYAEQALALSNFPNPFPGLADPETMALTFSFRSLSELGYLDQARLRRDEAVAKARRRGHAFTLAVVLGHAAGFDQLIRCAAASSLERADELAAHCAAHGFPFWGAWAQWNRGTQLLALDRAKEGLQVLTKAWVTYRTIGAVVGAPAFLISLAKALAQLRRSAEGLEQIEEAARHIEATEERCSEAELHRIRGSLLVAVGDPVAAETSFRRAIAVARRQNAKVQELRAALDLARLWRDQGRRTEARDLLAPIYGWFTEGFDTPVLQEAKALLDELAA